MLAFYCNKSKCERQQGAAVAEWLSSWLAEQEDRGSIPGLATWIFRDWLSPASKPRYNRKIAKSTLILKTTNKANDSNIDLRSFEKVKFLYEIHAAKNLVLILIIPVVITYSTLLYQYKEGSEEADTVNNCCDRNVNTISCTCARFGVYFAGVAPFWSENLPPPLPPKKVFFTILGAATPFPDRVVQNISHKRFQSHPLPF